MTSAQQNVLNQRLTGGRWTLRFDVVWSEEGQGNVMAGATQRERRSIPIRGIDAMAAFPEPQAGSARAALIISTSRSESVETLLLRRCLTTLSGLRPRMNLPLSYRRSITTKVMSSD
jgi:hypothetical protein